jgi:hypothetical protein
MDDSTHEAAIKLFLSRQDLVHAWMQRVLDDPLIPSARRLEPFRLRDYVPRFIDTATEALRRERYDDELRTRAVQFGRVHAVDRLDAGFTLDEVRRELEHLEAVLTEQVRAPSALALLAEALDEARAIVEEAYGTESGTRWREAVRTSLKPVAATSPDDAGEVPRWRAGS